MLHRSIFFGLDTTTYNPNTKVDERFSRHSKRKINTTGGTNEASAPTHKRIFNFGDEVAKKWKNIICINNVVSNIICQNSIKT